MVRPWPDGYAVAFDCESDCGFEDIAGYTREEKIAKVMQFTVICARVIPTHAVVRGASADDVLAQSTMLTWWRDVAEIGCTPIDSLLDIFDDAEVIVGYNILSFDFPLLKRFYGRGPKALQRYALHRCKALDIMVRVRDVCGVYYKLDKLLLENDLSLKIGDGAKAVRLWNDGKRDELEAYCAEDVALTTRLALAETLTVCGHTVIQQQVHGLRSAIAAARAASHKRTRKDAQGQDTEEEFVMV